MEYETPPINVANIQIHDGDRLRYHWELSHHDDKICYDQISRIPARADNPHWMLDDHKITRRVYSLKTADRIQTAFDPLTASLFIVSDSVVNIVNLPDSTSRTITVKGGYREMTMSNNLVYRPSTGELVSFDLNRGTIATFDFPTATWSNPESHSELEAVHANHSHGPFRAIQSTTHLAATASSGFPTTCTVLTSTAIRWSRYNCVRVPLHATVRHRLS